MLNFVQNSFRKQDLMFSGVLCVPLFEQNSVRTAVAEALSTILDQVISEKGLLKDS
jgi:hypothetical protein